MNNDTISRRGAIKAIEEMGFQKTSTVKAILCRLETLPSTQSEVDCQKCIFCGFAGFKQFQTAQPERKKGER